ncbi:uncharacterized protein DFL_000392 [Arthrobotrys flagrans]|uniref:Uncharacterized protein n=1 Tax=Arthrobotrys flagrans TaxID=97331 RepID=A0A437AE61_ARTFL|nr:hypothetical protein DFL_000392 [Arthrobotrys flagrans]
MYYYREGTKCNFGPLDFAIGIKGAYGTTAFACYVNRDVFLALAPNFEQDVDHQSVVWGEEISEFWLPFDTGKKELLSSFATFINEGTLVPKYELIRMKNTIGELVQEIKTSHRGQNCILESETMEWLNASYECTTEAQVKEFKITEIYENVQLLGQHDSVIGYSQGQGIHSSPDHIDTDTEDDANGFEDSVISSDDFYTRDIDEEHEFVEETRDRVMFMDITSYKMDEKVQT